jgi:phospholipid/cholesterol/gamma-HCH transport system substrate-binding protein
VSDYEAIQRRRNQIVGLFVLLGLAAFVWLVFRFGDLPVSVAEMRSFHVYAQFASAPGVQRDTPVRFCGYQVGRVTQVLPPQLMPGIKGGKPAGPEYFQTTLVMNIENAYKNIPIQSQIKLMTRGFGSSYIEIVPPAPDPCSPFSAFMVEGNRVQGSVGVTSELFPEQTQRKLEALADDLSQLVRHADQIVGDPNAQQDVKSILANLSESSKRTIGVMDRAAQTLSSAEEAIEQYRQLAVAGKGTLASADAKLERLTVSLVQTTDEVGRAASQMRQIIDKVGKGEGTLGMLVNDGRLYEDLLDSTEQLDVMIQELTIILERLHDKGLVGIWKGAKR